MTDVIQRNAANIVALSVLLFSNTVALTDSQSLAPISGPLQDALLLVPNSHDITPNLLTA